MFFCGWIAVARALQTVNISEVFPPSKSNFFLRHNMCKLLKRVHLVEKGIIFVHGKTFNCYCCEGEDRKYVTVIQ